MLAMVFDINSFDYENHAFSDIGCLVRGALQASGDDNGLDRPLYGGRLGGHIVEQILEDPVIVIHLRYRPFCNVSRKLRILVYERRYNGAQHVKSRSGKFLDGVIGGKRRAAVARSPSERPPAITSAIDPDLGAVRKFIADMLAKGAVAVLVTAIVALLVRMRDLNTELMGKLASKSRKRPPNEAIRRLQMELPFLCAPAANDGRPALPDKRAPKKRGAKEPTPHGRPRLPSHLPRVPNVLLVPDAQRICPHCKVETTRVCLKTTAEKLDIRPSEFIVSQTQVETCACPKCRQYIVTADKGDEVLDRGILGDDLLVQALADHYQDSVPWERMEQTPHRNAGSAPSTSIPLG